MLDHAETSAGDLARLDLTEAAHYRDGFPHEIFATLRRESPVWWQAVPAAVTECADEGFWVLSKYHDVRAANRALSIYNPVIVALEELSVRLA